VAPHTPAPAAQKAGNVSVSSQWHAEGSRRSFLPGGPSLRVDGIEPASRRRSPWPGPATVPVAAAATHGNPSPPSKSSKNPNAGTARSPTRAGNARIEAPWSCDGDGVEENHPSAVPQRIRHRDQSRLVAEFGDDTTATDQDRTERGNGPSTVRRQVNARELRSKVSPTAERGISGFGVP